MKSVLNEIFTWSRTRPPWQRDALRRLIAKGELDATDIEELLDLCKSKYGLGSAIQPRPLEAADIPAVGRNRDVITLASLVHRTGVNALAPNQKVEFGPSLTVVYGENASGKSGYTRILKRACRARGAEEILGNVTAEAMPGQPTATIDFRSGKKSHTYAWSDGTDPHPLLSRVSVFDRYCASVYISKRTDVAYRPLGLDLFDKLSDAAELIKRALEKERRTLQSQEIRIPDVAEGTEVHRTLSTLTSLTDTEHLKRLATITDDEENRRREIRRIMAELTSDDPDKAAKQIKLRIDRTTGLVRRMDRAATVLSDDALSALSDAWHRVRKTKQTVEDLRATTFKGAVLRGTGSDTWRALWHASERFSQDEAYQGREFPVTGAGTHCVLCQQALGDDGSRRLAQFSEFITSDAERQYAAASKEYAKRKEEVASLRVLEDAVEDTLREIELDDAAVAQSLRTNLDNAVARQDALLDVALREEGGGPTVPTIRTGEPAVSGYIDRLQNRVREIEDPQREERLRMLSEELRGLEARCDLARNYGVVVAEIERKKRLAAYQECIRDTSTNAITKKSSELTRAVVTETLTDGFRAEARTMGFEYMEVEMVPAGGKRGVLFHKLQLRRAPNIDIEKVMSEGEARCLSIAAFFAELRTASHRSAILFDDPVSSLDHRWRRNVVARLVREARERQVVVFTHDIVFLVGLITEAEDEGVQVTRQNLWKGAAGAGISDERGPWAGTRVTRRIGFLKDEWQKAEKMYRMGDYFEYEKQAEWMYGKLRESWERGMEEVLLEGTIERFRESIQTLPIRRLADIDDEDCAVLYAGMKKSSTWLPGHDQAAAVNAPIPQPDELKRDIETLEQWIDRIRKRRR